MNVVKSTTVGFSPIFNPVPTHCVYYKICHIQIAEFTDFPLASSKKIFTYFQGSGERAERDPLRWYEWEKR